MRPDSAAHDRPRSPFAGCLGPAMFAYIAWTWWQVSRAQIVALPSSAAMSPGVGASLALIARVLGWLLETGYYVLWWKWRGRALPFGWYFQWTAAISMVDLLAEAIRREGAAGAWRMWLVGAAPWRGMEAGSWAVALGDVGLLALVRLALVIQAQREALAPIGWGPTGIVAATWLAGRLAAVWTHDLLGGARLP